MKATKALRPRDGQASSGTYPAGTFIVLENKQRQGKAARGQSGCGDGMSSLPLPPSATSISRPQCTTSLPRRGGRGDKRGAPAEERGWSGC